ncbi:MAG: lactate utilization protein B [Balneolaceae bacterium]
MSHPEQAEQFLANEARSRWHDETLWQVRAKRDRAAGRVPEWEELRETASAIKSHTLSRLDHYLVQFEKQTRQNGVTIHWASNAEEHNRIVHSILEKHAVRKVVKSKSMLTEECGLNGWLETHDIETVDTDLGERIVQLAKERPSHIVMPAIHKKREEIDELFQRTLHTRPSGGDAVYLTREARRHLRQKFLEAEAAITGVNFAVAETGEIVVCTNEGNADMGVHLAPVHIACMGIEKLIPRRADLGIFLRLLARSATGQSITSYSSHFRKPEKGRELHIVLVDNGRTRQLGREKFRQSLACIRCGACMNTCPVYRRSGGHSYGSVIPGPIGAILSPGMDLKKHASLPFASTLCGSCSDVCPVKIDIHEQLYQWRQIVIRDTAGDPAKSGAMGAAGQLMRRPRLFRLGGKVLRWLLRRLPRPFLYSRFNPWGKQRELPDAPEESFFEWYKRNRQ